jgi:hypothetical protein
MSVRRSSFVCLVGFAMLAAPAAIAGSKPRPYSPYAGRDYPTEVFWGDTHLHTESSMDAGAFGNRLNAEAAYRLARGEEVVSSTQQPVKLSRPLDFLVVADHSDGMGFYQMLASGDPVVMAEEEGRKWHRMLEQGKGVEVALEIIDAFSQGKLPWKTNDPKLMTPVWKEVVDAAERFNHPGTFTAFIGYEWTSLVTGNNLHRVVIFRDDGDKAIQVLPYTNSDSSDPEDFWTSLEAYEKKTGGRVLAIPHNGNLSNGMMFADTTLDGEPLDKAYATRRNRWEPLYEATQIKGDGETHPLLSPDDEFADFETWDVGNLDLSAKKTDAMIPHEYAREALKLGLRYQAEFGVNPFEFGMIGSTDSHTSLAAVEENNFFGKHPGTEPKPARTSEPFRETGNGVIMGWQEVASGYAGVWAVENTRASIWDAMKRKEVYATTGPRMTVRFFGGWEFDDEDAATRSTAEVGYAKGVPMGATLPAAPRGKSPTFLVAALRDPLGANLDRIQIIKGWRSADGRLHEKVHDVVWGDAATRKPGVDGKLPPVGNTVDVANTTWTDSIGDASLTAVFEDPDFDAKEQAFYYVRVLEIPTPRWTAYDARRFGLKLGEEVPMTLQERAYTSPIWYTPK